jgi:hypothetical protein
MESLIKGHGREKNLGTAVLGGDIKERKVIQFVQCKQKNDDVDQGCRMCMRPEQA